MHLCFCRSLFLLPLSSPLIPFHASPVISIATSNHKRAVEFYIGTISAFLLVFWIFVYHVRIRKMYDKAAEQHAMEHLPMVSFIYDIMQLLITFGVGLVRV